jgi:hypothetical protein
MKTKLFSKILLLATLVGLIYFTGCKSKDVKPNPVDVRDAKALSKVIFFTNDTKVKSGELPTASSPSSSVSNNPSVSISTTGGTVYIPVAYSGSSPIAYVCIQVKGADVYFIIPVSGAGTNGQIAIPITLPATLQGSFEFVMVLVAANGSTVLTTNVIVPVKTTIPLSCGNGYVAGNAGITLTEHALNGKSGAVNINYDTYSAPDRIDVYLDGKWVAGTGSSIAPPPPLSTCANPAAGFVGKTGTFTFNTSSSNQIVQVYVSGCTGSTTAWNYNLSCPI